MTDERGQSESVGVILLTAVVVVTTASFGIIIFDSVTETETTNADLDATVANHGVVVTHGGGESIPLDDLVVVVSNETSRWLLSGVQGTIQRAYSAGSAAELEAGEAWVNGTFDFSTSAIVSVDVYDRRTGTRLASTTAYPVSSVPEIATQPMANFTVAPDVLVTGETVSFSETASDPNDDLTDYRWTFGDGASDAGPTVNHTYTESGEYAVALTVEDDDGNTDDLTRTIVVTDPPTANFTWSPENVSEGQEATFDGGPSSDPDGSIASYEWTFPNANKTGETVNYTFPAGGTYNVTLTVTDDNGSVDSVTKELVVGEKPTARFDYTPETVYASDEVTFDGSNSSDVDGTVERYEWDFDGDGVVDNTSATATHVYDSSGTYNVNLTVEDEDGLRNSTTKTVSVGPARPQLVAASVENTPIGQNDTDQWLSVTVTFDRPMDTSVAPNVTLENLSANVAYDTANASWLTNDTYEVNVSVADADEETTAHVNVSGAVDETGDEMLPDDSHTVVVDTTVPTISAFEASNPSGSTVRVSFDASESLSETRVTLNNSTWSTTLTRADFTESGSGPYTYTANYTVDADGNYTATLDKAFDGINDGASGESDKTTVGPSADSVELVGYDSTASDPTNGNLTFTIENVGYENVTIAEVEVTASTSRVKYIDEDTNNALSDPAPGNVEILFDATVTGHYEGGDDLDGVVDDPDYSLGTVVPLSANATMKGRSTASVTLYEFQDQNQATFDISGQTIYVTVTYADGSSETFAVTVP